MNGLYGYPMSGTGAMSALGKLGASDGVPEMTMASILNGDMAQQLQDAKTENYDQMTDAYTAQKMASTPQERTLAAQAIAANLAARVALQEAISKYSTIVGWIQTFAGSYAPPQLSGMSGMSGMGIFGIDDAAEVIALLVAAGVAITVTLYAINSLMATILGRTQDAKGYLSQLADLFAAAGKTFQQVSEGTSSLVWNVGIAAALGIALYFGVRYIQNRRAA